MKMNKFLLGILGVLTLSLASCSSDEPGRDPNQNTGSDSRFMSVAIRNVDLGSRAGGDQSGDVYEEGLDAENAVKSLRFYFFDNNGMPFSVTPAGNNYYDCTEVTVEEGNNMPYVEKFYRAVIVLNTQEANYSDLKSMVAVVNADHSALGTANKSLVELQAIVANYGEATEGKNYNNKSTDIPAHLMTSSVYGTSEANAGCEIAIAQSKLATSEADANANPVDVYVERVLAKVRVTAAFGTGFNVSVLDNNVIRVQLKDQNGKDYVDTDNKQIYAELQSWGLQTYTDQSYLFKNVTGWNGWDIGEWWNDAAHIRSYWAINPAGVNHVNVPHTDATAKIGSKLSETNGNVTTTIVYDGDFRYTQENAGDVAATGHKSNYNPTTATSNRTQVYIKAKLVDQNGNAIDLVEWGGQHYTTSKALDAMLGVVNASILTCTGADGTYTYKSITPDMIKLVNAEDIDKANTATEVSKRYLSYIQLTDEAEETEFFDNDHNALTTEKVNEILAGVPGAKVWQNGDTYYYADLTHLNPSTATADNTEKGAFGVVRNHIYEVQLNSIFGLGTPVLIPVEKEENPDPIVPQKPTPDAYYLGARLNILSWRVVANEVKFEW